MNGPTLTVASAIDSTTPFHRSHSTSDLFSLSAATATETTATKTAGVGGGVTTKIKRLSITTTTATVGPPTPPKQAPNLLPHSASTSSLSSLTTGHSRSLSLKSLPSLPAFDVPSFDFDFDPDFSSKLLLDTPRPTGRTTTTTTTTIRTQEVTVKTSPLIISAAAPERPLPIPDRLSRKRSIIDRPRSWMPTVRSTPNFRELMLEQTRAAVAKEALEAAAEEESNSNSRNSRQAVDGDSRRVPAEELPRGRIAGAIGASVLGERSRTVSDSLATFSRRSWMTTRSRSPSPAEARESVARSSVSSGGGGSGASTWAVTTSPSRNDNDAPRPATAAAAVTVTVTETTYSDPPPPTPVPAPAVLVSLPSAAGASRKRPMSTIMDSSLESSRPSDTLSSSTTRAFTRASIYLTKIKQKPQSVFSSRGSSTNLAKAGGATAVGPTSKLTAAAAAAAAADDDSDSCASSATSLADNRASSQSPSENTTLTTADDLSSAGSTDNMSSQQQQPPSRDPLWQQFRTLETEFARFQPKNTTIRMAMMRAALYPFLRGFANHESNRGLPPHDLEYRANILNSWWTALLDMMDSTNPQPVAGVDRPTLLECATLIMARPEWRQGASYFCPLADRSPAERVRARSWTQSTMGSMALNGTSASAAAAAAAAAVNEAKAREAAEAAVRTMFITNLLNQMGLVVDKMSTRHAPLSLVNFCGRACAYAFFFAPGIADVLVRLWGLTPDLIRRAADELGLPRRSKGESEDIVALFPPCLSGLGWTSVKTMTDKLRQNVKLPLLASSIPWHGPWVNRWKGRDTDLLFVFAKHFHVLAAEFIPAGLPLVEKARSPAFVLVHCQLLACLDSTVHRQAAVDALLAPGLGLADDAGGVLAALAPNPLLPQNNNLFKGMGENRMVVLLRDFLSSSSGDGAGGASDEVRDTFAEAFMAVVTAATKRTMQFDHNACFTLCDFLEEALPAYCDDLLGGGGDGGGNGSGALGGAGNAVGDYGRYVDWDFWFDVCRRILDSNHTVSEIRMLSFIFSIWDAIAADPVRKSNLCLGWLLTEENFDKFFNHWCPMVRAYYHRLLCWRMCRDSGSANEVDTQIFLLVSTRLKTVWSHYLWLKQSAELEGKYLPSTTPCYPTPGKRFMIIRTEVGTPQHQGLFASFDSLSGALSGPHQGLLANAPRSSIDSDGLLMGPAGRGAGGKNADGTYKKKWSLLGKVLSFTSSPGGGSGATVQMAAGAAGGKLSWDDEFDLARKAIAAERARAAAIATASAAGLPPSSVVSSSDGGPPPPPPPPKQPLTMAGVGAPAGPGTPSPSDTDSTGSSPVYDAAQFVFKFTLAWPPSNAAQPQPRILTRPRLPAPAQARVSARNNNNNNNNNNSISSSSSSSSVSNINNGPPVLSLAYLDRNGSSTSLRPASRSGSPPPPPPGMPPPNRRFSGLRDAGGLVDAARNASPLEQQPRNSGSSFQRAGSLDLLRNSFGAERSASPSLESTGRSSPAPDQGGANHAAHLRLAHLHNSHHNYNNHQQQQVTMPIRPTGAAVASSKYAGRSLAEWSLVVSECNSFVDRRRDEGILGLSEVEVPCLGVEGFRKIG